ncbi:MAG: hypothetical protein AMS17_13720 [Spirochaetes bacterium DG_61]|jgi:hypothetical protein|nr:MAG: hypothetical protein AMS17_13720 [Spirochaetes bacterium DG_61]
MFYPSMFKTLDEAINAYEQEYEQRPEDRKLYYLNDSFIQVFPEYAKQSIISRIHETRDFAISTATGTVVTDIIYEVKEWVFNKDKGGKELESASRVSKSISERILLRTGTTLNNKRIEGLMRIL